MSNKYYLIDQAIVPEVYEKVVKCNELIQESNCSISEACLTIGVSRAAYYKYKDAIFIYDKKYKVRKVVISMMLRHSKGCLADVLKMLSDNGCNILTINQNIPVNGKANIIISFDLDDIEKDVNFILEALKSQESLSVIKLVSVE